MGVMYEFFWLLSIVWIFCACAWGIGLFFYLVAAKGKRPRWFLYLLIVTGIPGFGPVLYYMGWYTVSYIRWHPTVARVSGNYRGSFTGEQDALTLRPNGTFTQQFVTKPGHASTYTGKWQLHATGFSLFDFDSTDTVTLDKLIVHLDGKGSQQKPRFALVGSYWSVDRSSLNFNSDDDGGGSTFTFNRWRSYR